MHSYTINTGENAAHTSPHTLARPSTKGLLSRSQLHRLDCNPNLASSVKGTIEDKLLEQYVVWIGEGAAARLSHQLLRRQSGSQAVGYTQAV